MHLLIAGATGLVGQATLRLALGTPGIARIVAPTRRPLDLTGPLATARNPAPPIENPVFADFGRLPPALFEGLDAVACALGSTRRQAGREAAAAGGPPVDSAEAFRQRDHDVILHVARLAREAGVPRLAVVSSVGADPRARSFYLRVKGELEEALRGLGFPSLTLLRPSLLDGERGGSRPLERLGLGLARLAAPLIPPRYRAVSDAAVAQALLAHLLDGLPLAGVAAQVTCVESEAIARLAAASPALRSP
jgi:uncharacterized protein YbjT (DUF2867 family)